MNRITQISLGLSCLGISALALFQHTRIARLENERNEVAQNYARLCDFDMTMLEDTARKTKAYEALLKSTLRREASLRARIENVLGKAGAEMAPGGAREHAPLLCLDAAKRELLAALEDASADEPRLPSEVRTASIVKPE